MSNRNYLEDIIESDNQLPGYYFDDETVPAYYDDTRFQKIEFKWLKSCHKVQPDESPLVKNDANNKSSLLKSDIINTDILKEKTKNSDFGVNCLLLSYYFKMEDIICLKSVEPYLSDKNMLRFTQFLVSKNINFSFYHPISCLASDYKMIDPSYDYNGLPKKRHQFEIIVER